MSPKNVGLSAIDEAEDSDSENIPLRVHLQLNLRQVVRRLADNRETALGGIEQGIVQWAMKRSGFRPEIKGATHMAAELTEGDDVPFRSHPVDRRLA